ncbi:glycoside hydrolase family 3 N-terminal domain-containing protein [Comamonas composti]|uniref:glycoside hydrolase family 3 N-terminal domain-containing protein n=1 Tax=Comamonas composti TaxID=408558 RepID=UPI000415A9C7|nr:glycoside hydrolase family 3 N-terminal domain-containing protein [Comamonas composti]
MGRSLHRGASKPQREEIARFRSNPSVTALETHVTGMEWAFAPTVTVPRDMRWGRSYEGYAERPELVAEYARAMVEGLQGKAGEPGFLGDDRIMASIKHFVGDGGTFEGRDQGDTRSSEATLRDIHAAGYVSGIAAGAQSVMASYSSFNGLKMHAYKPLLTDVLKGRMHFGASVRTVGHFGNGTAGGCVFPAWRGVYRHPVQIARQPGCGRGCQSGAGPDPGRQRDAERTGLQDAGGCAPAHLERPAAGRLGATCQAAQGL